MADAPKPPKTKKRRLTKAEKAEQKRKRTLIELIVLGLVIAGGALAVLLGGARFGVLLPQARVFIEASTNGLKVGRMGRLQIEGLSGDIWRDVTIKRLSIRDEAGVWLEADNVHMTWRYIALLKRDFHADRIVADEIRVLKRPTLTAKGKDTGLPISFRIDQAHARVVLMPEFSYARGVYNLDLNLDVGRKGGARGKFHAASVLRTGDHLNIDFDVAKTRPLVLEADIAEAQGGALAGALGFPPNQQFAVKVTALGKIQEGQFASVMALGAEEPMRAQGSWTKDGGVGTARFEMTSSTLTAPFARRLGPEAVFILAGQRAGPDLFALDARLLAVNLNAHATGLGHVGERRLGPQGLQLDVRTPNLSRITGGPELGATRITGGLNSTNPGWRFAGAGTVSQASVAGYSLTQASGPLELTEKAGVWTVKTSLAGSGGRGAGFVAAALGASPRATLDGARLADGRLSLKTLELNGQGLQVEASGGQGLLGGLTFKGKAALSNLAAARPGAAGSATASWSAGQDKAGDPWALTLQAQGDRFASGYPELDRLLGAKPQLKAQASVRGRRVAVGSASLAGAAVRASTAGTLSEDGALAFKLDWNADGPFRAGPVEITGKAKGSGAITGSLGEPRADLTADLAEIDFPRLPLKDAHLTLSFLRRPDGSSGMIAATASSAYGPARGRADFRFPQGGLDLSGLSVDAGGLKATGGLSLRRNAPSAADLQVDATRGILLDSGRVAGSVRIADAGGGARATLNLTAENARLAGSTMSVRDGRLTADGPLARLPYVIKVDGGSDAGKWALDGRGVLSETAPGYTATFDGSGGLAGRDVKTVETAVVRFGGPERTARLRLATTDGGRVELDGRLTDAGTDVTARATSINLGMVMEDMLGRADATLTLQGRGARLDGTLDAKLSGARGRGTPVASGIDGTLRGRLADNSLNLDLNAANAQGLKATGNITLPTEASGSPLRLAIARQRPMQGRFSAEGEVSPLWDLFVGGERSLSGKVTADGTIAGTLADPRLTGQAAVAGGKFEDGATGLSLRDVSVKAAFAQNAVNVTEATGSDGRGGSVSGAGRISLARDGASSFKLDLKNFRLIDNDLVTASASGQATIDRAADGKGRLTGDLTINRADSAAKLPTPSGVVAMDVVEKNRPANLAPSLPAPSIMGEGWALDVRLRADRGVYLRGRGLDVEMSLDARVTGTTTVPVLTGVATVVRGDYEFAGKRFEIDPESAVYLSTRPEGIRLDLSATRDDPSLSATVRVRGTAARPEITLTSSPSLPNDEVLSQILFGASASQLSPIEAAQLASALASFSGGGGLDVVGNLRAFAGLDRLALGGNQVSGVTVAGGKYLTDNVYLEIIGGGREGGAAQVEWRVRKNLSIISRVGGQGDGRLAVRWRRDY